jgi:hypothetical protein
MKPSLLALLLLLWCTSSAWAVEELAKEIARRDAEVAKAKQVFDAAVGVANERALKTYARIAQRSFKSADVAGATAAWTEVLRIDRKHVEAVAYFTTIGTLEAVLAELDQPTDLLGNPVGAARGGGVGKNVLVFGTDGALQPSGDRTLGEAFSERTTELVIGKVTGDGVVFEEGGGSNGQAIGVIADELHYILRAGGTAMISKVPFDRAAAWTHVAAQFDAGEVRVWLNGRLATKGKADFSSIPPHGGGGLGKGDGSNSGGWAANCQFLLGAMRISGVARFSDQSAPDGRMETDRNTLLAITPEAIAAELSAVIAGTRAPAAATMPVQRIERMPPTNLTWTASGEVGIR